MTQAIEVDGVSKSFKLFRERPTSVKQRLLVTRSKAEDFWALRDISFAIEILLMARSSFGVLELWVSVVRDFETDVGLI